MATIKQGALSSGLATVTFADRYQAFEVKNKDATTGLYVRADGVDPTLGGADGDRFVGPGERCIVTSNAPLWYQGQGTPSPGATIKLAGSDAAKTNAFEIACVG